MTDPADLQIGALLSEALRLAEPERERWLLELEGRFPE